MFRGSSNLNLDDKGRIAVPARYRESITAVCGGQMIITRDYQSSDWLNIYPLPEWDLVEHAINALPNLTPAARRMQRRMLGGAHDCEMSAQGRLTIPPLLREKAGLDKQVVLIGQGKRFELWDAARWEAYDNALDEEEDMEELGSEIFSTLSL